MAQFAFAVVTASLPNQPRLASTLFNRYSHSGDGVWQ